jgi:hypothetical protein
MFSYGIGFSKESRSELKLDWCGEKSDGRCGARITTSGFSTGTETLI